MDESELSDELIESPPGASGSTAPSMTCKTTLPTSISGVVTVAVAPVWPSIMTLPPSTMIFSMAPFRVSTSSIPSLASACDTTSAAISLPGTA